MPSPNPIKSNRTDIESDVLRQVTDEVHDTIRAYAPKEWSNEQRQTVEDSILNHSRAVLSALSTTELQSLFGLQRHIESSVAETMRLIHQRMR